MIGMGLFELLLIFVVALIFVGPDKMPETARKLAKLFGEFRRMSDMLRSSMLDVEEKAGLRDFKRQATDSMQVLKDMHPKKLIADAVEGVVARDTGAGVAVQPEVTQTALATSMPAAVQNVPREDVNASPGLTTNISTNTEANRNEAGHG